MAEADIAIRQGWQTIVKTALRKRRKAAATMERGEKTMSIQRLTLREITLGDNYKRSLTVLPSDLAGFVDPLVRGIFGR